MTVSEVFSPPRVTKLAPSMGFRPGLALDLTVLRDDGEYGDFSRAGHRREARQKLDEENPILLIGSPECKMYCKLQARKRML